MKDERRKRKERKRRKKEETKREERRTTAKEQKRLRSGGRRSNHVHCHKGLNCPRGPNTIAEFEGAGGCGRAHGHFLRIAREKEPILVGNEEEEGEDMFEEKVEKQEEKEEIEDAKENKTEDTNSTVSHSPTISCRSDTSNNSICSFAFPV